MKDIDFDELDRAVNSLISPGGTPADASSTTPVSAASTPSDAPSTPPVASAPTPPLAERRSSGRFMDVVHPSSDMRGSATVPPRPASREAATTTPPSSEDSTPAPDAAESSTKTAAWPDPIDFHAASQPTPGSAPAPKPNPQPDAPSNEMTKPLETPFLTNAKVEKRPLGAFSTDTPESTPDTPSVEPVPSATPLDSPTSASADDTPSSGDRPIKNDTPMPAELQPGLLSIESNEDSQHEKEETAPTAASPTPTGPTSITQQYKEQPSTGDKPAGTVFNTEAYKKPQSGPKKKSGLFVVLWIFLLLVVGAGVGAAVYFFVLPNL